MPLAEEPRHLSTGLPIIRMSGCDAQAIAASVQFPLLRKPSRMGRLA